jgi:hypothetical protein
MVKMKVNMRNVTNYAKDSIRLLQESPNKFMRKQIRDILKLGDSEQFMTKKEFREILEKYLSTGEYP